jgi:RNA polymerase sigma-70 factor (ECF subfamily)
VVRIDEEIVRRCYQLARAERWTVSVEAFAAQLAASAERAFAADDVTEDQLERYLRGLHLEDLALACACADGHEPAWEHFILEYRPILYRAADAIAGPDRARDVADSLYGELFGLRVRDGDRRSHLRYFHGRSSLATWLRAVLSQRYVDSLRHTARLDPLPDEESEDALSAPPSPSLPGSRRYLEILERVLIAVIGLLPAKDRLRLRCYYAQEMTLAEIGRITREHEATVSRHLARTRKTIRAEAEKLLRERERMSDAEIAECFAAGVEDSETLDLGRMMREPSLGQQRKEIVQDRSE